MPHQRDQWKLQLSAIAITLFIAIVSGIFTGFILRYFAPSDDIESYSDAPYWEVMDDFGRSFEKEYEDLEDGNYHIIYYSYYNNWSKLDIQYQLISIIILL